MIRTFLDTWFNVFTSSKPLVVLFELNHSILSRLQDHFDINSLPDSLLQHIFGYLSPKDLCQAAQVQYPTLTIALEEDHLDDKWCEFSQVCRHWNACANFADLWKTCAYRLGMTEGVGSIVQVMETVIKHYKLSLSGLEKEVVDWKRVYRDLLMLIKNMKHFVIKTITASQTVPTEL